MMKIYYENNKNVKLDLLSVPYRLQTGDLFNYRWKRRSSSFGRKTTRMKGFSREIISKKMLLGIMNRDRKSYYKSLNYFHETVEKDVIDEVPGRLYVGETYLQCYIVASAKTNWECDVNVLDNEIELLTDGAWITEKKYEFIHKNDVKSDGNEKIYDYTYNECYYPEGKEIQFIENDSIEDADFKMIIYGPCSSVSVRIGEHLYNVAHVVQKGEYAVIDTRENAEEGKRVYLVKKTGEQVNLFHYRDPINSIFTKIQSGIHRVECTGANIDITLYKKRSEPKWS